MTYVQPLFTLSLIALLVVLAHRWRTGRLQKPLGLFLAWGAVFLIAWPPAAQVITRSLEVQYPPRLYPTGEAQAIVVLASGVLAGCPPVTTPVLDSDTFERCQYAAWLHNHWKPLPVLASGGTVDADVPPYATVMAQVLERGGVPANSIWIEDGSHSTNENAVDSAKLLRQKQIHTILLVTAAYHMPRAAACFRRQGLTVIPAACGYRSYHGFYPGNLWPGWEAIAWNEDALHEAVGLVWYRMRGWI